MSAGEPRGAEEGKAGDRDRGASQIPRADRLAFIAIGTAAGVVRARAALVAVGRRERPGARSATMRARQALDRTVPRDADLVRLKRQTLGAVATAEGLPEPGIARSVLSATAAVDSGLRGYAQRHPAIGGVIPD